MLNGWVCAIAFSVFTVSAVLGWYLVAKFINDVLIDPNFILRITAIFSVLALMLYLQLPRCEEK
ncbi:hypothetical protein BIW53_15135 [Pseudoalteromonas byunsanensis]|uniref:Uncharacterized protein n=1 Tax=Pseudoalteromonas byunsanensis TaxID=327939 RepID=A0A1S1N420_9GAMM|nr:hypothetical protein BIW53_15135 [Pseudoalteromonas byunsanensis]